MSSPFISDGRSVSWIMHQVLLALLPVVAVASALYGTAVLIQLTLASVTAWAAEALVLRLRGYPLRPFLSDGSALITAWLLALAIPPLAPWWVVVTGCAFAMIVAKHLYGGLGQNLFNPAMVGFAVLLISFPAAMTHWPAPLATGSGLSEPAWQASVIFGLIGSSPSDALSMATPLDALKTGLRDETTVAALLAQPLFALPGPLALNLAALLGGLYLLARGIIRWQIPLACVATLGLLALLGQALDPARLAPPLFHLLTGATLLGAFFVATDSVTAPASPRGQLIYGAGIGALIYAIRSWGNYPDAIAFAVLIANTAVPLLDAHTRPPVFGHREPPP